MSSAASCKWIQLTLLLALLLVGCNQVAPGSDVAVEPVGTPVLPTAPSAIEPNEVVEAEQPIIDIEPAKFTLRIWLTAEINALPTTPGGEALARQLQLFDDNHPDVDLDIQVKNVAAQGGSLSYLRAGRTVAPSAMPDLILLPSSQLAVAHADGLIFPLDDLVSINGLYPAAQTLGTIQNELFGYPLALTNLQHFVYNGNVLTEELPSSWSALIVRERARALFAGAGSQGAALALQLYLAQGGTLEDGEDGFAFQNVPLTAALEQIRDGVNTGVIQRNSADISTPADTWTAFQSGSVNVAMVDTNQLLSKRLEGNTSLFGPIPGRNGNTTPILQGWLLSISTPDPARQSISAELIAWLAEAENQAAWSESAGLLPSQPAAINLWANDSYVQFIKSELPLARAYPKTLSNAAQNALSNAVVSIITSPITPEDAADFVIQTLSP